MKGIERERESERESIIIAKSPKPRNKVQTKVDYTKLSFEFITQNYRLVYYFAQKWMNYRDIGISKNVIKIYFNPLFRRKGGTKSQILRSCK